MFDLFVCCRSDSGIKMAELADLLAKIADLSPEDRQAVNAASAEPKREPAAVATDTEGIGTAGLGQMRISQYSGDSAKGDVSYEQWRFEVRSMVKEGLYREPVVLQLLRRSLRGTAADILLHMGEGVSVQQVLAKMDRIFGNVLPPEQLLEVFFTARQQEKEKVAAWACRLEDILSKLQSCQEADAPYVPPEVATSNMRAKFYSGLRSATVRMTLRHHFDAGVSYEKLLVAARAAEAEEETEKKTAKVNQATAVDSGIASKMDKMLAGLEALQKRMDAMEKSQQELKSTTQGQKKDFSERTCFKCGQKGHIKYKCPLNLQTPASGGSPQVQGTAAPPKTG